MLDLSRRRELTSCSGGMRGVHGWGELKVHGEEVHGRRSAVLTLFVF